MTTTDYERLELLFRRSLSLPVLPAGVTRLIHLIDEGEASARDLERLILADPTLAIAFMRALCPELAASADEPGSISRAIVRVGQHAVRVLAISLGVQGCVGGVDLGSQSVAEYSIHCLAVGLIAKYLTVRRLKVSPEGTLPWAPDELLAAGVLHDLGSLLLARVSPSDFSRIQSHAKRRGLSLSNSFASIYGNSLGLLAAHTTSSWQMPELFQVVLTYQDKPWERDDVFPHLCDLAYADFLATSLGYAEATWTDKPDLSPEITMEASLSPAEVELLAERLPNLLAGSGASMSVR